MKNIEEKINDTSSKFIPAENFDETENLIVIRTKGKQAVYHSKMSDSDVHVIVSSSAYARQLICSGENINLEEKIFEKVISLQDRNPESANYGLWPYYLEENIEDMDAPDKNMAGFNSREMLEVLYRCGDFISEDIKDKILGAVTSACRAIIRRNEDVQYTRAGLMRIFCRKKIWKSL